jgi:predicted nucleic acid-binding protein
VIFVDSSVWVDYFRGRDTPQTEKLDGLFGSGQIVVGDLVLTKVLQGFVAEREFTNALEHFNTLHIVRLGGYHLSVQAARNFRILRGHGYTVRKTIDSLIATRCIADGLELLHNDRDFIPFEKHLKLKCVM